MLACAFTRFWAKVIRTLFFFWFGSLLHVTAFWVLPCGFNRSYAIDIGQFCCFNSLTVAGGGYMLRKCGRSDPDCFAPLPEQPAICWRTGPDRGGVTSENQTLLWVQWKIAFRDWAAQTLLCNTCASWCDALHVNDCECLYSVVFVSTREQPLLQYRPMWKDVQVPVHVLFPSSVMQVGVRSMCPAWFMKLVCWH